MPNIKQFEIYWAELDPTRGSEIQKTRPCVIVSPNELNNVLRTVIVVPLTSTIIDWPFRVLVLARGETTSAACDQVRAISKERLRGRVGEITANEQEQLTDILQSMFSM